MAVPLDIQLRIAGNDVKRYLQGFQKESARVERQIQREIEKTDQARTRSLMNQRGLVTQGVQHFLRGERQKQAMLRQTARELRDSIWKATRDGVQRSRQILRDNAAAIGGGVALGTRAGFRSIDNRVRTISQIPEPRDLIPQAKQFELRLAQLQTSGGLTDEQTTGLRTAIMEGARGRTLDPMEILAAAEQVVKLVGGEAIPQFINGLSTSSDFAEGFTASVGDLSVLTVQLQEQFGIGAERIDAATGLIAQSGQLGSIEIKDFASEFITTMALFRNTVQQDGIGGLRDLASAAQAVGFDFLEKPGEAKTALESLLRSLSRESTQNALSRRVLGGRDVSEVGLRGLAFGLSEAGLTQTELMSIFGRAEAVQAAIALQNRPEVFDRIAAGRPGEAVADAAEGARRVRETQAGLDRIEINKSFEKVLRGFEEVSDVARYLAAERNRLKAENLLLTEQVGVGLDTVGDAGLGYLLIRALFPRKGGAKVPQLPKPISVFGGGAGTAAGGGGAMTAGRAAAGLGRVAKSPVGLITAGVLAATTGRFVSDPGKEQLTRDMEKLLATIRKDRERQSMDVQKFSRATEKQERAADKIRVAANSLNQAVSPPDTGVTE